MKAQKKHAEDHKFPGRYIKFLSAPEAHSDDEWSAKLQAYITKTPIHRSIKAGLFMRRVDDHMKVSAELNPLAKVKPRPRLRPRPARPSKFTKPPKGASLDSYDPDWFNSLSVAQRTNIADCNNVAFLPNPELSLLGTTHPDEQLSDKKFTEKHWSEATKFYNLDHSKVDEEDSDDDSEGDDSTEKGSVDLSDTEGDNEEDEEFEDVDEEEEEEFEDEAEFEDRGIGKGKGKAKVKGSGPLFVDDDEMEEGDEEEARVARLEAWNKS